MSFSLKFVVLVTALTLASCGNSTVQPPVEVNQDQQKLQQENFDKLTVIAKQLAKSSEVHPLGNVTPFGKTPTLSWRVLLLASLGKAEADLYRKFDWNEPWDGPNNKKLLTQMPDIYRLSSQPADATTTYFQRFDGPGAWADSTRRKSNGWPTDGTLHVLGVVIAGPPVPWTKPEDIPYNASKPLPKLSFPIEGVFHVSNIVGETFAIRPSIPEAALRGVIESDDGSSYGKRTLEQYDVAKAPPKIYTPQDVIADEELSIRSCTNLYRASFGTIIRGYGDKFIHNREVNNQPILSWRVMILGQYERDSREYKLYQKFNTDEPWDGPNNKKLLAEMPAMYRAPNQPEDATTTYIKRLDAPIEQIEANGNYSSRTKPTARIALIEAGPPVPWSKPEDIPYNPNQPLPNLHGPYTNALHVMIWDRHRFALPQGLPEATFRELIEYDEERSSMLYRFRQLELFGPDYTPKHDTDKSHIGTQTADAARSKISIENMKAFGRWLIADQHRKTVEDSPPYVLVDNILGNEGKPILSWRVEILKDDIRYKDLYNSFKLDEPWDGPNNIKLLIKMPGFYRSANQPYDTSETYYKRFTNPVSGVTTPPIRLDEGKKRGSPLKRGEPLMKTVWNLFQTTIVVVEAGPAVPWTKPEDIPYDPNQPLPNLTGPYDNVLHAVTGVGTPYVLNRDIPEPTLRKLIEINDKNGVGEKELEANSIELK